MIFFKRSGEFGYPSIDALLSLKDELNISDKNWHRVKEVFQLPNHCNTYHITTYRRKLQK